MGWRQRYESLVIVYDLENPKRRVMDYISARIEEDQVADWTSFLARKHNMKRYGYVLYHKVASGEVT